MGVSPHLERAYSLARTHRTHPNPRVGAVVVSASGEVIGEGAHHGPGQAHAEVIALDQVATAAGATLYVSLEPCSHQGRTPPCVDKIIANGVSRVVIGASDPDPRVSGNGAARLREAGIHVDVIDDPAARSLDPAYFHHRESGLPLVTLKYAMTLDGAVAAADGSSQWITSEEARLDAHRLRAASDAVVVGAGTLTVDDPLLDVRLDGFAGPQPRPVVVAGTSTLPSDARIWERNPLVVSIREREVPAGDLLIVEGDGRPDPMATCRALAELGHLAILLEGGPTLVGSWWRSGVVSRGVAYVGARIGGGRGMPAMGGAFASIDQAETAVITGIRQVGPDIRVDFESRF